ncbi:MAG TPA: penicillin-binding protein 2 [Candidatus Nanopelagicaceae bacterium]|nr:penicillin-binding protein 2 [Candidatus Nanopelagicaceae bacterium]
MSERSWRRLVVVQVLIASMMLALMGRLYYMQIASGPMYNAAALDNQSRDIITPAARGMILDDKGVPLAMERTGLVVSIDYTTLQKQKDGGKDVLTRLAKVLGTKYATVRARTTLCGAGGTSVTGCWNGSPYQPIPLTQSANPDTALQIIEHSEQFPGVTAEPQGFRYYPEIGGTNAAHILGYIGQVSADELKSPSAQTTGLHQYDIVGKAGLEYQYDPELRGQSGIKQVVVDRTGAITKVVRNTPAVPGDHLVTSIDSRVQKVVEDQLAAAVARARAGAPGDPLGPHQADGGAAIVMDVTNGRIIAMASYPTYDPNIWANGLSVKQAKSLFSETSHVPALNRAIQTALAPASTFKVVSLAAASAAGYNLNANYNCPASLRIGDRTFTNFEGERPGLIPMRTAIALSCDTVWYQIAYDMWVRDGGLTPKAHPADYFFKAAKAYRIGQRTGVDLPSEVAGRLADRQWKIAWYNANKHFFCNYQKEAIPAQRTPMLIAIAKENCVDGMKIRAGDAVNFAIGQGDTTETPIQMAQIYAAVANGGTLWQPTIGRAILKPDGTLVREIKPKKLGRIPMNAKTLAFTQNALRAVVTEGTAHYPFIGFPISVSAKTGTGEVYGTNPDGSAKDTTSWLATYAPTEKPRYVVVMMVSQGGTGSLTGGPSVRKIYEALFGIKGSTVNPADSLLPGGPPTALPSLTSAGRLVPLGGKPK